MHAALKYTLIALGGYMIVRALKNRGGVGDDYYDLPGPKDLPAQMVAKVIAVRGIKSAARVSSRSPAAGDVFSIPRELSRRIMDQVNVDTNVRPTIEVKKVERPIYELTATEQSIPKSALIPVPITPVKASTTVSYKQKEEELRDEIKLAKQSLKSNVESTARWMKELAPALEKASKEIEQENRRAAAYADGSFEKWSAENKALDLQVTSAGFIRIMHEKTKECHDDNGRIIEGVRDMAEKDFDSAKASEVESELRQFNDTLNKKYWIIQNPNPTPYGELGNRLYTKLASRTGAPLDGCLA